MPNRSYLKGKAKEWRIKQKFQKEGYIVIRSAGSKSPFDLIGINKVRKRIVFIQAKPKNFSLNKQAELYKEFNWVNDEFSSAYIIE